MRPLGHAVKTYPLQINIFSKKTSRRLKSANLEIFKGFTGVRANIFHRSSPNQSKCSVGVAISLNRNFNSVNARVLFDR